MRGNSMENCGNQSDSVTSFPASFSAFPCQCHSAIALWFVNYHQRRLIVAIGSVIEKNREYGMITCIPFRLSTTFLKWRMGASLLHQSLRQLYLSPHCVTLQYKSLKRRSFSKVLFVLSANICLYLELWQFVSLNNSVPLVPTVWRFSCRRVRSS